MTAETFDYIVVGAGSAGCVVASRLSEDPATRVLVLEAGPEPKDFWIKVPAGMARLFLPGPVNWGYFTEPEPHLDNRKIYWPRGKTLGGSSAINGMAYVRGHAQDFDDWRQMGCTGWSWADVLPLYKRSERRETGATEHHGAAGELSVSDPVFRHASSRDFVESGVNIGLARNLDLNGDAHDGIGFLQFTINKGQRHSSYEAFLAPVRRRPNLKIETGALTRRILVEQGRAVGIEYEKDGQVRTARANAEVVLSAGALNTPQILMLSGIGPGQDLARRGIPVVLDLPGVGRNLQDHLYVHVVAHVTADSSINRELRSARKYLHGANYLARGKGYLTMGASQACAFVSGLPGASHPDLQINFRPVNFELTARGAIEIGDHPQVTASVCHLRPQSRGRVELRSADPKDTPVLFANYLDAEADRQALIAGVRWIRRIFAAEPFSRRILAEELPGPAIQSDAEILGFVRRLATSMYHPVGTARMGIDAMAVVDPALKVRGLAGLRVADASIMPTITSGNTNAPSIMIGEKAADLIRAEAKSAVRAA
ncbi:GMC family oxidoreductase [Zavarzinia sp. CC-PAN008]|uniref:GMC family oxidoreductase n=1 Tax=Zavarzinia sp. CC-PAN008 TaxID=3243332 RepID=UPI003F74615A